jgi:hypothetical protein
MCRLAMYFLPTIRIDTDFPVWKSEYRQLTIEPRGVTVSDAFLSSAVQNLRK